MKQVWHIFQKDFRVLRGPWLVWMAILGLGLIFANYAERYPLTDPYSSAEIYLNFGTYGLIAILLLMAYLLMPSAIHEDPLTDANADWVVRPISSTQLLAAKLLGVFLLFVVAPVLVKVPWWLAHDYNAHSLARAALYSAGTLALVAIPSFWVACLARDSASHVRRSIVLLVGGLLAIPILFGLLRSQLRGTQPNVQVPGLIVPVMLGSILYQFYWRRTGRNLAGTAVAMVVACLFSFPLFPTTAEATGSVPRGSQFTAGTDGKVRLQPSDQPTAAGQRAWIVDTIATGDSPRLLTRAEIDQQRAGQAARWAAESLRADADTPASHSLPGDFQIDLTKPVLLRGDVIRLRDVQSVRLEEGATFVDEETSTRIDQIITDPAGLRFIVAVTTTSRSAPRLFGVGRTEGDFVVQREATILPVPTSPTTRLAGHGVTIEKRILTIPMTTPDDARDAFRLIRVSTAHDGKFTSRVRPSAPASGATSTLESR